MEPTISRRAAPVALALALAACAGTRPARAPSPPPPAPERRVFEVPGHGALELAVPTGWTAEAGDGEPPAPLTIRLVRPGDGFLALVTPFWNPGEEGDAPARADTAQLFAELARRKALGSSVEREIPLEELVGADVHGFWFAATDRDLVGKEAGPDEWRHVMQGAAAVGPLVVAFTLLDNGPGPQRAALLELVRGARHVSPVDERRPAGGMQLDPDAVTVPLAVAAPGRTWMVLVDLPGFRMFRPRPADDGVGVAVLGQDPETGLVASVILRAAGRARDAAGCREADLATIREGAPGLEDLRVEPAGAGAARAAYALPELRGEPLRQEHAHAWLFRDGVCANVHVSKMKPAPGDAEAMERILATVRFGEEL